MQMQFGTSGWAESARYALAARRGIMRREALPRRSREMLDTLTTAELEEMAPPEDPSRSDDDRFDNMPV